MATIDSLEQLIDKSRLKVGNDILQATGTVVTASKPIYADSASKLASGALPFSVPITPSTSTTTFLTATGTATSDLMTANVVVDGTGGATTFTKKLYLKVSVVDSGAVATNGDYYIQLGLLT